MLRFHRSIAIRVTDFVTVAADCKLLAHVLRVLLLANLCSMTNPANVVVIVDKLINYLRQTTVSAFVSRWHNSCLCSAAQDQYLRTELVSKINSLAEKCAQLPLASQAHSFHSFHIAPCIPCNRRFAPNTQWYLQTMNNVFELGGDLVKPEVSLSSFLPLFPLRGFGD